MKEAPGSSETSVLTRATRRNNPEDTIIHSYRRENLKSYSSLLKRTNLTLMMANYAETCNATYSIRKIGEHQRKVQINGKNVATGEIYTMQQTDATQYSIAEGRKVKPST
jgi:hypothetical protein